MQRKLISNQAQLRDNVTVCLLCHSCDEPAQGDLSHSTQCMFGLNESSLWPWSLRYGKGINEDIRFEKHTTPFPAFAFLPSGSSRSVSEDNWESASLRTTHMKSEETSENSTYISWDMNKTFTSMFNLMITFAAYWGNWNSVCKSCAAIISLTFSGSAGVGASTALDLNQEGVSSAAPGEEDKSEEFVHRRLQVSGQNVIISLITCLFL